MVLVAEVRRGLGTLDGESIAALTANQQLVLWVDIEVETCKKGVRGRFHIASIHQ
jgi:hypothetical protein